MLRALIIISISLLTASTSSAQEWDYEFIPKKNSIGIGLGIPYGIVGASLDVNVRRNLNVSGCIGHTIVDGFAYNLGLKYFLLPADRHFRPRASAWYGINAGTSKDFLFEDRDDEVNVYTGLTLGIGAQFMFGRTRANGFDIDIIYVAFTNWDEDKLRAEGFDLDGKSDIKFSIGYRHGF